MEKSKNKNIIIIILSIVIVILLGIIILLASKLLIGQSNSTITQSDTGNKVSDTSNDNDTMKNDNKRNNDDNEKTNNSNSKSNSNVQTSSDKIKVTNFSIEKPYVGNIGGSETNTLLMNVSLDLECSDNQYAGIRVYGYCFDQNSNKYMIDGPVGVISFQCSNGHNQGQMMVGQVLDSEGKEITSSTIQWDKVNITYCKINEVSYVSADGLFYERNNSINYDKKF